jgi:hypothetical protein
MAGLDPAIHVFCFQEYAALRRGCPARGRARRGLSRGSSDGAKRNPGLPRGVDAAPDFALLHPGYTCLVPRPAIIEGEEIATIANFA